MGEGRSPEGRADGLGGAGRQATSREGCRGGGGGGGASAHNLRGAKAASITQRIDHLLLDLVLLVRRHVEQFWHDPGRADGSDLLPVAGGQIGEHPRGLLAQLLFTYSRRHGRVVRGVLRAAARATPVWPVLSSRWRGPRAPPAMSAAACAAVPAAMFPTARNAGVCTEGIVCERSATSGKMAPASTSGAMRSGGSERYEIAQQASVSTSSSV